MLMTRNRSRLLISSSVNGESHMEAYLRKPEVIFQPGPEYAAETRAFQGIPSLARGRNGRLWAVWYGGITPGEDKNNYVMLSLSTDRGRSWSSEKVVIEHKDDRVRCFDPEIWRDPTGRLWLFWAQHSADRRMAGSLSGVWTITADEAQGPDVQWSGPRRISDGVMMCKPIVLSSGEWALPVSFWHRREQGSAAVVVSTDQGRTFEERGAVSVPSVYRDYDEHMLVERKDGSIWMLVRTKYGVGESVSLDAGRSWSALEPAAIPHVRSRFFIRRLNSGRLLLVRHEPANAAYASLAFGGQRSGLTAFLSQDDGHTWPHRMLLDERVGVSYPDGDQAEDGAIHLTYDYDRHGRREILCAAFREEDILAAGAAAGTMPSRGIISRYPFDWLLPDSWNPVEAANRVMAGLIRVSAPHVRGAHDAEFVCVDNRAYIVEHDNDVKPGHGAGEHMYCVLTIVNLDTLQVEKTVPLARSEESFANVTLPRGMCFVPRIIRMNETTLRCFFASQPDGEEAQTWMRDFDLESETFSPKIHKAKLKTAAGVVDMQPRHLHADAVAYGFDKPAKNSGMYIFDSFKVFDGKTYVALNNFPGKQNALSVLHDDFETFEVIGHYNEPLDQQLSESAVNRLPDGSWMAICRNDSGNYHFTTSPDGRRWTKGRELPFVVNGGNSKPTFDCFGDTYYLGWQEKTRIGGCGRSVFNLDISQDCRNWERKYRFETSESFQYPTFHEHQGAIWLSASQSDHLGSTDRIMFGKLEERTMPKQESDSTAGAPAFAIVPPNPPNDGILFVEHATTGRSGHLGHALVEVEPGHILAFYANCSDVSGGHNGDGWMEYRRSTDGGRSWSEPRALPYSKETYDARAGRSVMCEKTVRLSDGTLLLFNLECANVPEKRFAWQPLAVPTCLTSRDQGETWSAPQPVGDEPGRIWDVLCRDDVVYALELANDSAIKWYGNLPEHHYSLYVSDNGGRNFSRWSILPFEFLKRGYGALAFLPDGGLIAYVYSELDEKHLDYTISSDQGRTWEPVRQAYFAKQIRNPQIAAFRGGYVLHGRSGSFGEEAEKGHFVLYTSPDGIHWDEGRYVQMRTAGAGAYSNNLLVHDPDGKTAPRLLIQASHAYDKNRTNIHHWWLT